MNSETQFQDAKKLLGQLIACPSLSREEEGTATIIEDFFKSKSIPTKRLHNNVGRLICYLTQANQLYF